MIKWPRKSHRRRAREGQRERATRTSMSKETFIVDATVSTSTFASLVRDTRVVQIRCRDEPTHVKVATLCTHHRSHGARAGALNASSTRHDAQTVIKKSMFTTLAASPLLVFARAFVGVVRD